MWKSNPIKDIAMVDLRMKLCYSMKIRFVSGRRYVDIIIVCSHYFSCIDYDSFF